MAGRLSAAVLGVVLLAGLLVGPASVAADADYYNNSSRVVQGDAPADATLDNILGLFVDLSPDIIGTGERDPSGTGFQGVLLTGLMWAGALAGAMIGTGVGPVGGGVVATTLAYGLVDAGYAPVWLKPILLFGVGIFAFIALRRVVR